MKVKWTLMVVASLASLLLATGVAYADEFKGESQTKTTGTVQVEFITEAEGTIVGESHIAVQLKDTATGQPIVRDSVQVELTMDEGDSSMNHGSMSNQKPVLANLKASAEAPGKYSGKVPFTDAGDWKATVLVDGNGARGPVSFGVHVVSSGPNWLVIGGFIGVLALVVVAAAMAKRKGSSARATISTEPVQS